ARVSFSLSKIATTISLLSFPFISHAPVNKGEAFECGGTFRTARAIDPSCKSINSDPQMNQDMHDKRSEISLAPRSLRARSACLFSRSAILSLDMRLPVSAFGMSEPH